MTGVKRRRLEAVVAVSAAVTLVLVALWNVARDRARAEPIVVVPAVEQPATQSSGPDPAVSWRRVADAVLADERADRRDERILTVAEGIPNGVCVAVRGADGSVQVFGDRAPSVGSVQALVVLAVAVEMLGRDHRFSTEVRAVPPVDGVIDGDVWLIGGGDPLLASDRVGAQVGNDSVVRTTRVDALAATLDARGVTAVTGDVIGDGRLFDSERRPAEWPDDIPLSDAGRIAGLVIDGGRIWVDPRNIAFDPVQAAARSLVDMLTERGVSVSGSARRVIGDVTPPDNAMVIARTLSVPLSTAVAAWTAELPVPPVDVAETLLRHIGVLGRDEGSRSEGADVVREVTRGWGTEPALIRDGSGLAGENAIGCDTVMAAHEQLRRAVGAVPATISGVQGVLDSRGVDSAGGSYRVLAAGDAVGDGVLESAHAAVVDMMENDGDVIAANDITVRWSQQ